MIQHWVPYRDAQPLPDKVRPMVRYRRESFGYLAAFPDGHVGLYDEGTEPLLAGGAGPDACRDHLLPSLRVPVDFHFAAPLMAWVEITRRCNLRCPHCFVEGGTARATELSTARIMRLLDEWAAMGVFSVVITGGEPSIHPDFLAIVNHAWELGFVVSIASNGSALGPRLLDQIPRDDVIISVSLDGLHWESATERIDEFDHVTARLLAIRDAGFNTSIMTTTTHANTKRLQRIIGWAVENDISLRSVPFVPMGRGASHRELANVSEDVDAAARFWLAEEQWERVRDPQLGLCAGKVFNFLLTMVFATRRCMSGRGLCYVTSDGDVYPCTTCSGGRVLCGGNVQLTPFAEVWEDEWEIRSITWDTFRDTCAGCPINEDRYFCTGRCPSSSYVLNRRFDGCGTSEFQRASILRREELFRENVMSEPKKAIATQEVRL